MGDGIVWLVFLGLFDECILIAGGVWTSVIVI